MDVGGHLRHARKILMEWYRDACCPGNRPTKEGIFEAHALANAKLGIAWRVWPAGICGTPAIASAQSNPQPRARIIASSRLAQFEDQMVRFRLHDHKSILFGM